MGWRPGIEVVCALLLVGSSARAQDATRARLRLATNSFVFGRYATVSAPSLYAAYGLGKAGLFLGMVTNPRSGYHEQVAGVFTRIERGRAATITGVAFADAADSKYLQLYLLPSASLGPLAVSGTIEWYLPVEAAGVQQLEINPITGLWHVAGPLSIGAAFVADLTSGTLPGERAGPVLDLGGGKTSLRVEVLRPIQQSVREVRFVVVAGF